MDDLIKDGKNNKWVVCKFCESKVLRPSAASYEEREVKYYTLCDEVDLLFFPSVSRLAN